MLRKQMAIIVLFFLLLTASDVLAHHPSGGAGAGMAGPIRTISASTLQQDKWSLGVQTELIKLDTFTDKELHGFAARGHEVHTFDSVFHASLGVSYGITDDIMVSMKIPYVVINDIREAHSDEPEEVHRHGEVKGIGDFTALGQYRFIKMTDAKFESAVLFGLKMPTGDTRKKDVHWELLETEHQPGSGSWDPMAGISVTKRFNSFSIDTNLLYTIATKGAQETDLGDLFNYNFSFSYRTLMDKISLDLILEINGECKQRQKIEGAEDKNSGGNEMFLSPGFRISFNKNLMTYLSVGIPVIRNLNGLQTDTKYKTLFGIGIGF
jgi:hypothetical protein